MLRSTSPFISKNKLGKSTNGSSAPIEFVGSFLPKAEQPGVHNI